MARAKRTERAEARRRYRAAQGFTDAELDAAELADDARAATATSQKPARGAGASGQMPQRIGIGQAFRLSFRPLDLRGDVRAFPRIATRTKSLWIPVVLTTLATIAVIVIGVRQTDLAGVLTNFAFQYFVYTPAIGGVFIAGFLAPRASWLLGIVVGLFAAACFSVVILAFPLQIYPTAPTNDEATAAVGSAFFLSPVMGALFASAAAWYRRFLALSSPNRARQLASANANRPNGRSRAANARR